MTKETPLDDPRQKTDQELKPGPQMDELLRKIRQLETAPHKRVASLRNFNRQNQQPGRSKGRPGWRPLHSITSYSRPPFDKRCVSRPCHKFWSSATSGYSTQFQPAQPAADTVLDHDFREADRRRRL